jgi:uncharacterized protein
MEQVLYNFVEQNTTKFDSSHNIHHAIKVYNNSIKIINSMEMEYDRDIITWASLLHDICDHKYDNSIPKDKLYEFIKSNLGEFKANRIINIIDNISFSKEIRGERCVLPYPDYLYLDVISDADRLEAIGYAGIRRCESYIIEKLGIKNPELIKANLLDHCHAKLLKLFPDYFRTFLGKELAEPLNNETIEYVFNTINLT